ncbi:citrate/2-methylcitrate synthase [Brevundimonas denitrificans]|uniref:citrate/2-methylcitrate synthase n=1 Tax=Brevundimonas denitrificans TaxID=1443434 RepID=UPI00223B1AB2|nr:citrate/2-methylcitrate synthase [Brevundimonas denitrificans]
METAQRNWIGRNEALDRLGVKTQTLYAYVSRGRITARPDPENPRRSLYAADDVARLCDGSPAPAAPAVIGGSPVRGEATVQSSVTAIMGGRLFYRGRDAIQLAEHATLEDAARVLWNARDGNPFATLKPRIDVAYAGPSRSRLLQFIARRVDEDPPAAGRAQRDLTIECAGVLSEMVDAIVGMGPRLHLHQRLARAWKIPELDSGILRRALVLSADHELNGAVLATRAVAGTGASPPPPPWRAWPP